MVKIEDAGNNAIQELTKEQQNGGTVLRWKANFYSEFLIVYAEKREKAILSMQNGEEFAKALDSVKDVLLEEKIAALPTGETCYLKTFQEVLRDNGMRASERPGFLAVYGIATANADEIVLYLNRTTEETSAVRITVDVHIRDHKRTEEKKKLFSKPQTVYLGYHEVILDKGYPMLPEGILQYSAGGYTFNIPRDIVKNGGRFFVRVKENETLTFKSNSTGVDILL